MHRLNRWVRDHPWTADLPLYLFLLLPPVVGAAAAPAWAQWLGWAGVVLPLALRRRRPGLAAALLVAAVLVGYLTRMWPHDGLRTQVATAVALYAVVVVGRRRVGALVAVGAAVLAPVWALVWVPAVPWGWALALLGAVSLHLAAWAFAEFVRARREFLAESRRRAVAEERARIARELHDVLAHGVTVVVVQAEAANLVRDRDPERVASALDVISRTGREALSELRRLLDVIAPEGQVAGPVREWAPLPGLAELPELVRRTGAGRPVRLAVTGDPAAVPAGAAVQVYRIVREALTNVLKHAPADAAVAVRVVCGPEVAVEVVNSGGARRSLRLPSSRRGLAGLAGRAELVGGSLRSGPTADGGFRVTATLPAHAGAARPPDPARPATRAQVTR